MPMRVMNFIDWVMSRPIEYIVQHFENRLFELAMSTIFVVEAVFLLFSPASMGAGGMKYLSFLLTLEVTIVLFLVAGIGRMVALALNGHWVPYGTYVRAVGAALGVVMWLQVAAALWTYTKDGNAIPFSTPIYVVLAIFEGISMFRALAGVKRNVGRHQSGLDPENVGLGDLKDRIVSAYFDSKRIGPVDRRSDHRPARASGIA